MRNKDVDFGQGWPEDGLNETRAAGEKTALSKLFKMIDAFSPTLITWNGNYFDMLVVQHRALAYGIESYANDLTIHIVRIDIILL